MSCVFSRIRSPALAGAALEQIAHAEPGTGLADVELHPLQGEGRVARSHEQAGDTGEIGDQIVGDAVAEEVLMRIVAHVGERQDGDRRSLPRARGRSRCCPRHHHAIYPDRSLDVLEPPLADIFELAVEPTAEVIIRGAGDGHTTGLTQLLEAGRDVHPVAIDAAVLGQDVGKVDPHPEVDPLGPGHIALTLGDAALNGDRTLDRVDHAGELAQRVVAREVDDPAPVLGHQRLEQLAMTGLEARQRTGVIMSHQPRIADHVRDQNGGQPALRAESGHLMASETSQSKT